MPEAMLLCDKKAAIRYTPLGPKDKAVLLLCNQHADDLYKDLNKLSFGSLSKALQTHFRRI